MSSIGSNCSDGSGEFLGRICKCMILALLTWCIVSCVVNSNHATEKHGSQADIVRTNCENGNVIKTLRDKVTGRTAQCVELKNPVDPDGAKYGVRISQGDFEVTAFIKENLPFAYQIIQYLERSGYK